MKVKSESEVTQSCPTFNDPMDCSLPGSSVHGIFQARPLEWGAIALSKVSTNLKGWKSFRFSCIFFDHNDLNTKINNKRSLGNSQLIES